VLKLISHTLCPYLLKLPLIPKFKIELNPTKENNVTKAIFENICDAKLNSSKNACIEK